MASTTAATAAAAAAAAFFFVIVVVMVTIYAFRGQFTAQIGADGCICITCCSGADLDACACQCGLSSAADTAAYQDIYRKVSQELCYSIMTAAIGIDDFAGDDLAIYSFIQFESFRVAEVLEDFAIFKGNCNFHK